MTLRVTLLAEGNSDRVLMPILEWVLRQRLGSTPMFWQWADLQGLPKPARTLTERTRLAAQGFPCDILFVHRDADRTSHTVRVTEIRRAAAEAGCSPIVVPVVPVKMQESWLLFDESAIRQAVGNPNGSGPLNLPPIRELERLPNPKELLREVMRIAWERPARRRSKVDLRTRTARITSEIDDFSPLCQLPAFQALEAAVDTILRELSL